jgi:hypothetical protein
MWRGRSRPRMPENPPSAPTIRFSIYAARALPRRGLRRWQPEVTARGDDKSRESGSCYRRRTCASLVIRPCNAHPDLRGEASGEMYGTRLRREPASSLPQLRMWGQPPSAVRPSAARLQLSARTLRSFAPPDSRRRLSPHHPISVRELSLTPLRILE